MSEPLFYFDAVKGKLEKQRINIKVVSVRTFKSCPSLLSLEVTHTFSHSENS